MNNLELKALIKEENKINQDTRYAHTLYSIGALTRSELNGVLKHLRTQYIKLQNKYNNKYNSNAKKRVVPNSSSRTRHS